MKTKNLISVVIIMFLANMIFAQKYDVNTQGSSIKWLGKKITGQHEGTIQLKSGMFELKDDEFVNGSFVIDMTTIVNTDLEDKDYNKKLVDHLKSDDFFGVEKYPTAKFVITKSTKFKDGTAMVTGDITIKDKTETMTFKVKRVGNTFGAILMIDRSKFDVRYGSGTFFSNLGDNTIDDIFRLDIKLLTD